MFKVLWIGGAMLLLLSPRTIGAEEQSRSIRVQMGPTGGAVVTVATDVGNASDWTDLWMDLINDKSETQPVTLSDYWLGVECYPAQGALRAQLQLPEGEGLVVGSVVADSPAGKAGIQQHDVLLKAGDKPLAKVQDLIEAVDAAKEKKLTLDLIRGGKNITLEVQPAKRPENVASARPKAEDLDSTVRQWFERVLPGSEAKLPMQFHIFRPGMILPPGALLQPPLPPDMTVVITRHGSEPAKIVVEQGDKRWEISEKELDKLPKDIRPHVERLLTPTWPGLGNVKVFGYGGQWPQPPQAAPGEPTPPSGAARVEGRLEKRLEEMNRRIEDLRKAVDELRERRPRLKAAPEKKPDKPAEEKQPKEL